MQSDKLVDNLVQAAHEHTSLMFENLGLKVSLRSLDSWPAYSAATAAMFGTHWLSRLWCKKLRPILKPYRQTLVLAEFKKQREISSTEYFLALFEQYRQIGKENAGR